MIQELWWSILKEFGGVSGGRLVGGVVVGVRGIWGVVMGYEGDMVALKSWWFMWKGVKLG